MRGQAYFLLVDSRSDGPNAAPRANAASAAVVLPRYPSGLLGPQGGWCPVPSGTQATWWQDKIS